MNHRPWVGCAIGLLAFWAGPAWAQQAAQQPALAGAGAPKGATVTVAITVRDKKGAAVTTLDKSVLTLAEDGRAQTILTVEPASQTPLRLGVAFDTSREMSDWMDPARKAGAKFVEQMLGPADKPGAGQVALLHYDRMVELLEDFTADRAALKKELDELGPSHGGRDERGGPETADDDRGPSGDRGEGRSNRSGAQLYDTIFLAADEVMRPAPGRHVLVLLSDGVDHGSKESLNEALDAAERAGITVYTLYMKGDRDRDAERAVQGPGHRGGIGGGWPGSGGGRMPGGSGDSGRRGKEAEADGKKTLEKIALKTGGRAFEVKKKDGLDEALNQVAGEIAGQLLVTYQPDMLDKEGGFHKLAIQSTHADLTVTAPEGYVAAGAAGK